jgi:hypothetical protein
MVPPSLKDGFRFSVFGEKIRANTLPDGLIHIRPRASLSLQEPVYYQICKHLMMSWLWRRGRIIEDGSGGLGIFTRFWAAGGGSAGEPREYKTWEKVKV